MKTDVSTPSFDLIVSLDRSDQTVAIAVLDVATNTFLDERDLSSSPEAMDAWWRDLRAQHPGARIAVVPNAGGPKRPGVFNKMVR